MKVEKMIELFKEHNKRGASIQRLTDGKYTEHQLLEDLLDWACGAAVDQRAFYKLTQMLYKTRDFPTASNASSLTTILPPYVQSIQAPFLERNVPDGQDSGTSTH